VTGEGVPAHRQLTWASAQCRGSKRGLPSAACCGACHAAASGLPSVRTSDQRPLFASLPSASGEAVVWAELLGHRDGGAVARVDLDGVHHARDQIEAPASWAHQAGPPGEINERGVESSAPIDDREPDMIVEERESYLSNVAPAVRSGIGGRLGEGEQDVLRAEAMDPMSSQEVPRLVPGRRQVGRTEPQSAVKLARDRRQC